MTSTPLDVRPLNGRRLRRIVSLSAMALLLFAACSSEPESAGNAEQPEVDAGVPDDAEAAEPDADSPVTDTGTGADDVGELDTGDLDAGDPDTGEPDTGEPDTGELDAGDPDTGEPDTGELDAGEPDAGDLDAGEPDTGEHDTGALDASEEPDTGEPDAGEPDTGEPDTGDPDAGESCTEICGDLTNSGSVDADDLALLEDLVDSGDTPTDCELEQGDVTGTGELDEDDVLFLERMIDGDVEGGCESCDVTCGDVTGNGDITPVDVGAVFEFVSGDEVPTVCQFKAADINYDGIIDDDDYDLIDGHIDGLVDLSDGCAPCDRQCGDVNGDGNISSADNTRLNQIILGDEATVCELQAADLNQDGELDEDDSDLLTLIRLGLIEAIDGPCSECDRSCGDVTGSGDVTVSDVSAAIGFVQGNSTPDLCEFLAADIDGDGKIEAWDAEMIARIINSTVDVDGGACPSCDGICGDITGNDDVTPVDAASVFEFMEGDETPTICEFKAADINRDGVIDEDDYDLIDGHIDGLVDLSDGCATCDRQCGDVNGDGDISSADSTRLNLIIQGAEATVCDLEAADLNQEGVIDQADRDLLQLILLGLVDPIDGPCTDCEQTCGDVTGSGSVSTSDISAMRGFINGTTTPDVCEFLDADINGDATVDERDINLARAMIFDVVEEVDGACPRCDRQCGDVNGNGEVAIGDVGALIDIVDNNQTTSICEFTAADVKADGALDEGDIASLNRLIQDEDLAGACVHCDRECGDVHGDGDVTQADLVRLEEHVNGDEKLDDICDLWAGKVTGGTDASLTQDDVELLNDYVISDGDAVLTCSQ